MTATVIPPEILEAARRAREEQRRRREAFRGSILAPLDEGDQPTAERKDLPR